MSIVEEPFGTSSFVLLFKVTVLNLYVTIMKPKSKLIISAARLWLNDNAMFYKTLFKRNYKDISVTNILNVVYSTSFNIIKHL